MLVLVLINVVLSEEQPAPKVNEHMKLFHMRQLLSRQASQYLAEIIQTKIKSDGKSQKVIELILLTKVAPMVYLFFTE